MIKTIVTGGQYEDPREYNGPEVNWCKRCQSDEIVEDTHVCSTCIDDLEERERTSSCCGDTLHVDMQICYACKEHSSSLLEDECMETGLNGNTYRYEV